ncbi:hypothetical protein NLJ89_g2843 [Agrocybe chaxingu]|uniref:FAD-binding PCMH-type domain-containing protein n=1 Tax=Agrocybe chaxingu TaxID=84603 RepID=A0A9W8MYQ6_9AGAR|nr:hypothetical protein NLJ89_g2843 [Agrocybe chaxingu]
MLGSLSLSFALLGLFASRSLCGGATQAGWKALNATVGGRLYVGVPFSQPCFSRTSSNAVNVPNPAQCGEIQALYEDHLFRSSRFGGYQITQWETCQTTGDECLLDWTNTSNPTAFASPRQCLQGSVPSYYIDVTGPKDIQAAYAFSKNTKFPLVIKNSGHDYIGRSAGPGTLALWIALNTAFVPEGCSAEPQSAVTFGAGVQFQAVYDFARANNVTIVGGADPAVGATGGWSMGAGHGALSPAMGLGVDRVLQYKIVTPDGKFRTANKCQNPDLFFALRGGGGGTFGVVLEGTFIASPAVTMQVVLGTYENTPENTVKLVKALGKSATQMASDGWGGYITPPASAGVWANPLLDAEAAPKSAAGVVSAFESVGGAVSFFTMPTPSDFFDTFIAPNTDPVGRPQVQSSRLISDYLVANDDVLSALAGAMVSSDFSQILAVTPYAFKDFDKDGTSINPAWRTAVWHALSMNLWNFNSTRSERETAYQRLKTVWTPVRDLTPGSGAYFNEADTYEPDYTTSFWGQLRKTARYKKQV